MYLLGAGGWELNARLPWYPGVVEGPLVKCCLTDYRKFLHH